MSVPSEACSKNFTVVLTHLSFVLMMKKITILLAMLFFAGVAYAQPNPGASIPEPKLDIIGGDTYDWGKVKPKDSPLKAKIKVQNIGKAILYIKEVKAGCGCTATKIDKDTLEPGESGTIDVSLNVATVTGGVTKTITVYSNDPSNNAHIIWLKAEVVRAVSLSLPYMAFNDLAIGKSSTQKISIKNNSTETITVDGFEATAGLVLNLKKKTEIKPGAELELIGTFIPQAEGYFNSLIKFTTSNPDFPTIEVSAYGNVTKPDSPVYQK